MNTNHYSLWGRHDILILVPVSVNLWPCERRIDQVWISADQRRELHLQSQLGDLRDLLSQTKNEPRLKGPFAFEFYQEVLLSCERMLDRLHSMRCVTTRDEW